MGHNIKIIDYPLNDYSVAEDGHIYSWKPGFSGNKVKPRDNGKGYLFVALCKSGKHYNRYVHRLVALAFIPNLNNYKEVNHRDGNKSNNHVDNLEWCDRSMNNKHAYAMKLRTCRDMHGDKNPNYKHGMRVKSISSLKSEREFSKFN